MNFSDKFSPGNPRIQKSTDCRTRRRRCASCKLTFVANGRPSGSVLLESALFMFELWFAHTATTSMGDGCFEDYVAVFKTLRFLVFDELKKVIYFSNLDLIFVVALLSVRSLKMINLYRKRSCFCYSAPEQFGASKR